MIQKGISALTRKETRRIKMIFELEKDLQENEVICEHCHGTGLEIADNVYGIKGDTTYIGVHFPYKHQSLNYCKFCHNGVMEKCPNCGRLRTKKEWECPCGYLDKIKNNDWQQKQEYRWNKAEKITIEEAWKRFKCLYVENGTDNYVFSQEELDDMIDVYELDAPLLVIYGTATKKIELDAGNIIDNACVDLGLHENADENCDVKSLQEVLDKWCKDQEGTITYYPDYSIGVKIK